MNAELRTTASHLSPCHLTEGRLSIVFNRLKTYAKMYKCFQSVENIDYSVRDENTLKRDFQIASPGIPI